MSVVRLSDGGITVPRGYRAAGICAGVKRSGRPDLAVILSDRDAAAAGVFTTNQVRAAPVVLGEELVGRRPSDVRGVLCVSGVANALTGADGLADQRALLVAAEQELGLGAGTLLPACTGVIGPRLPMGRLLPALPQLRASLARGRVAGARAAQAILTTDTRPKSASVRGRLADGTTFAVGGIAKGSGMIAPNLALPHATSLAFLTTDARVAPETLRALLAQEADRTFNMVRIDGDTSTNDTVYALANGAAPTAAADGDPALRAAFGTVLERLAREVARDGEGATKLLSVQVLGARNLGEARAAARAVAGSTLVKAAIFGADPNVGRIACALGYSGARLDPERIDVTIARPRGPVPLIVDGRPAPGLDNGGAARVRDVLRRLDEVPLEIRLHQGRARATAWGCDLSYAYVQINAAYHT